MQKYRYEPMMKLKLLRISKGKTLTELSKSVGLHYNTLSDYESGKHRASIDNLQKIAEALECEVKDII